MSSGAAADLAFVGGAVYTVDAARRWARAVAVKDGRIVAVGSDEDIRDHIGPSTDVMEIGDGLLLPGFQDAHCHPVVSGLEMLMCELHEIFDVDEYRRIVRTYAEANPSMSWILGGGWTMSLFPGGNPPASILDELVPDRPVFLESRDGHSGWANSKALEMAGVTAATPDPPDGRIARDASGAPAGTLHEGAMRLVSGVAPEPTQDDFHAGLLAGQRYLHALGITAWQDAIVDPVPQVNTLDTYLRATASGELTARVVGALWWNRGAGEEQIEGLVEARAKSRAGGFRATSVKIMQDGICENFTAAMIEPYLDAGGAPTENRGISFVEPELLKRVVTRLDALEFQVHFHTIGERAVREALDGIEAALAANGPSDNRHHLAHIQVVHPDDIPRFRELRAIANAQPLWAEHEPQMDELTIPFLGEPRWRWQYPFASLVRAGAVLALGSDWSVSSPNPLQLLHGAVNRTVPPGYADIEGVSDEPLLPEEAIDLPTAVAAGTMGSAYVNHLDADTGSIEVGKQADLALFDRNLFELPREEITTAEVLGTFVGGRRVYAGPGF